VNILYDLSPELPMLFTGSSILGIAQEEGELSIWVYMYVKEGLSFREWAMHNLLTSSMGHPRLKMVY